MDRNASSAQKSLIGFAHDRDAHVLNLFYEEPDPDRWISFDRYPRSLARRLIRGRPCPGGQMRVFLNLRAGLDRIGVPYRVNDYRHAMQHPEEVACILGKDHVLNKLDWRNPILLGSAIGVHPVDDSCLLSRLPIKKILVPGPWVKGMCEPWWGSAVEAWPVGIDSDFWRPSLSRQKTIDVLIYDKVRWDHDRHENVLIEPIRAALRERGLSFSEIRYGHYREEDFYRVLAKCRSMVFLCEHETQGIAYQQALSCDVPIFAWDRGGFWQDPAYYPHKVRFGPVTSVPYWDDRCGGKFCDFTKFTAKWDDFWESVQHAVFRPREYILDALTLEICARDYVRRVRSLAACGV